MTSSDYIAVSSALIALASLGFTYVQWVKINKVVMVSDSLAAAKNLPAWFTGRMMTDTWLFGFLTTSDQIIVINRVNSISDDGKWMDVTLSTKGDWQLDEVEGCRYVYAMHSDRDTATIHIPEIIMAFELATS